MRPAVKTCAAVLALLIVATTLLTEDAWATDISGPEMPIGVLLGACGVLTLANGFTLLTGHESAVLGAFGAVIGVGAAIRYSGEPDTIEFAAGILSAGVGILSLVRSGDDDEDAPTLSLEPVIGGGSYGIAARLRF